jgi:hypothetical protein
MPTIPNVRPRVLKQRLALVGLGGLMAAAVITMPAAKADPFTHAEAEYVVANHGAVCSVIDRYPTTEGVMGVMQGVMSDGWNAPAAVDIINTSVQLYCPGHWQLLVDIGREARGENTISPIVAS